MQSGQRSKFRIAASLTLGLLAPVVLSGCVVHAHRPPPVQVVVYEYYYYPYWEVYFDPRDRFYFYRDGYHWRRDRHLPPRFRLNHHHRVVVHDRDPWKRHDDYRRRYPRDSDRWRDGDRAGHHDHDRDDRDHDRNQDRDHADRDGHDGRDGRDNNDWRRGDGRDHPDRHGRDGRNGRGDDGDRADRGGHDDDGRRADEDGGNRDHARGDRGDDHNGRSRGEPRQTETRDEIRNEGDDGRNARRRPGNDAQPQAETSDRAAARQKVIDRLEAWRKRKNSN